MSELVLETKRNIVSYLSSHPDISYCDVVPDWVPEKREKPFEKPIIVVQPINMDLGETQSGSLYAVGNWTDMRFDIDIWTDKKTGGTIERDRIASALFSIFNFKGLSELWTAYGIKSRGIAGGTPIFEPEPRIYRCRMTLEVTAILGIGVGTNPTDPFIEDFEMGWFINNPFSSLFIDNFESNWFIDNPLIPLFSENFEGGDWL